MFLRPEKSRSWTAFIVKGVSAKWLRFTSIIMIPFVLIPDAATRWSGSIFNWNFTVIGTAFMFHWFGLGGKGPDSSAGVPIAANGSGLAP